MRHFTFSEHIILNEEKCEFPFAPGKGNVKSDKLAALSLTERRIKTNFLPLSHSSLYPGLVSISHISSFITLYFSLIDSLFSSYIQSATIITYKTKRRSLYRPHNHYEWWWWNQLELLVIQKCRCCCFPLDATTDGGWIGWLISMEWTN